MVVDYIGKKRTCAIMILFLASLALMITMTFLNEDISWGTTIVTIVLMVVIFCVRIIVSHLQAKTKDSRGMNLVSKEAEYLMILLPTVATNWYVTYYMVGSYVNSNFNTITFKDHFISILVFAAFYLIIFAITHSFRISILIQTAAWIVYCLFIYERIHLQSAKEIMILTEVTVVALYCFLILIARERKYIYYTTTFTSGRRPYKGAIKRLICLGIAIFLIILVFLATKDISGENAKEHGYIIEKVVMVREMI